MKTEYHETKTILVVLLAIIGLSTAYGQVGIGTTSPDPSSILDVTAIDKGFLPPRLTSTERDDIASPAAGLTIYNTDNKCLETYNGASWISLCSGNPLTVVNFCDPANPTEVVEVQAGGHTWMDRNLGASRAANASDDFQAYGNLFQWGRSSDGHECINWTSATGSDTLEQNNESTSQSASSSPGSTFIINNQNWYTGSNPNDLWKPDLTGVNNPCPAGFRIPSQQELDDLGITSVADAYTKLGLPKAGFRSAFTGNLVNPNVQGRYWSATSDATDSNLAFQLVIEDIPGPVFTNTGKSVGASVRCIKD